MCASGSPSEEWHARLELRFDRRDDRTTLSHYRHQGPLRLQKPLYPEAPAICHNLLLHPPAGVAGGDHLEFAIDLAAGAQALFTTPGAGKWYGQSRCLARQLLQMKLAQGSSAEWMPQENILFNGARAKISADIEVSDGAVFFGQEIFCLGRRLSGESFDDGELQLRTHIHHRGRPLWLERGHFTGGAPLLQSRVGLAGFSVCGTFLALAPAEAPLDAAQMMEECRALKTTGEEARRGLTLLTRHGWRLYVARYLGHRGECAREWFAALWALLRPALLGYPVSTPRIWST